MRDELAAATVEVIDRWGRLHALALQGRHLRKMPRPIEIKRPGERKPRQQVMTDPRAIAAWFAQNT